MNTFRTQLRKELHELWATKKAMIVLVIMLAFGFLAPITAKLLPELLKSMGNSNQGVQITITEPTVRDALTQFVQNTSQTLMFMVVLVSFTAIVSERQRGQMTLIFPHALPRSVFVLAKFAALALLIALGMVISAAAAYLYTALLFTAPDVPGFLGMVGLLCVYLLMFVALSLLGSTLGKSTAAAGGVTFVLLALEALPGVVLKFAPGKLTGWALKVGLGEHAGANWGALVVAVGIIVLAVAGSCLILNRQEIDAGA
jgi:ABC-2 type transport system permease protein